MYNPWNKNSKYASNKWYCQRERKTKIGQPIKVFSVSGRQVRDNNYQEMAWNQYKPKANCFEWGTEALSKRSSENPNT